MVQDEGGDVSPPLENDERSTWRALILAGIGILRAREVEKWPNRAVLRPHVEYGGSRRPSDHNTLRLGLASGNCGERRCIGGFNACDACIDARLRVELERQLSDERDEHPSRRRSNSRIRRSARFGMHVERVRARATVYGVERIVDGDVHHGVNPRFVEWVGEGARHASVAATPAFSFQSVTASLPPAAKTRSPAAATYHTDATTAINDFNSPRGAPLLIDRLVGWIFMVRSSTSPVDCVSHAGEQH